MEKSYFAGLIAEYCNYDPSATELKCQIPPSDTKDAIPVPSEDKVRLVKLDLVTKTLGKNSKYYASIMSSILPSYVLREFQNTKFLISRTLLTTCKRRGENLQVSCIILFL